MQIKMNRTEATIFQTKELAQKHLETYGEHKAFAMRVLQAESPMERDYESGDRPTSSEWIIQIGLLKDGKISGFRYLALNG